MGPRRLLPPDIMVVLDDTTDFVRPVTDSSDPKPCLAPISLGDTQQLLIVIGFCELDQAVKELAFYEVLADELRLGSDPALCGHSHDSALSYLAVPLPHTPACRGRLELPIKLVESDAVLTAKVRSSILKASLTFPFLPLSSDPGG